MGKRSQITNAVLAAMLLSLCGNAPEGTSQTGSSDTTASGAGEMSVRVQHTVVKRDTVHLSQMMGEHYVIDFDPDTAGEYTLQAEQLPDKEYFTSHYTDSSGVESTGEVISQYKSSYNTPYQFMVKTTNGRLVAVIPFQKSYMERYTDWAQYTHDGNLYRVELIHVDEESNRFVFKLAFGMPESDAGGLYALICDRHGQVLAISAITYFDGGSDITAHVSSAGRLICTAEGLLDIGTGKPMVSFAEEKGALVTAHFIDDKYYYIVLDKQHPVYEDQHVGELQIRDLAGKVISTLPCEGYVVEMGYNAHDHYDDATQTGYLYDPETSRLIVFGSRLQGKADLVPLSTLEEVNDIPAMREENGWFEVHHYNENGAQFLLFFFDKATGKPLAFAVKQ